MRDPRDYKQPPRIDLTQRVQLSDPVKHHLKDLNDWSDAAAKAIKAVAEINVFAGQPPNPPNRPGIIWIDSNLGFLYVSAPNPVSPGTFRWLRTQLDTWP